MGISKLSISNDLPKAIARLLPEGILPHNAQKRALDFVGKFGKHAFGLATNHDLQVLASHIKQMRKMDTGKLQAVKEQSQHLASFAKSTSDRLDRMVIAVKQVTLDQMRAWEQVEENTSMQASYLANITVHTLELEHMTAILTRYYTNFLNAFEPARWILTKLRNT